MFPRTWIRLVMLALGFNLLLPLGSGLETVCVLIGVDAGVCRRLCARQLQSRYVLGETVAKGSFCLPPSPDPPDFRARASIVLSRLSKKRPLLGLFGGDL